MKLVNKIVLGFLIVFIVAQFFSPNKNEGEINSVQFFLDETKPSQAITAILKESCFDCHSNHTRYPWYNSITPVNYWLNHHVEEGKEELNFSKWNLYSAEKKEEKLEEVFEEVEEGEMPLESYIITHSDAKLSKSQIKAIEDWVNKASLIYSLEPKPEY